MQANFKGESYLPSLGEKLMITWMMKSSPKTALLFALFSQESHHTYKRRQDWTDDGQKTLRTSKGTYRVEKCEGSAAIS